MRENDRKAMRLRELLPRTINSMRCLRRKFFIAPFLAITILLTASFGCAPSSNGDGKQIDGSSAASNDLPEITDEKIRQKINDAYLREVPEENGAGEPISWRFNEDEPKEFTVVEKQLNGDRATIILDIKTQSAPGANSPKSLAGQIRTKWELQTGWTLRTWELVESENISMKYKNLPKPPTQNSNR